MNLGNNNFVYNFEIVNEGKTVGTITAKGSDIYIKIFGSPGSRHHLNDIASIELIHAEGANVSQGGTGMVLGAIFAGPVGAFLGVSMGRLLREAHFILTLTSGRAFLCKSLNKIYEGFEAHRKIIAFETPPTKNIDQLILSTAPVFSPESASQEQVTKSNVITVQKQRSMPTNVLYVPKKV